MTCTGSVSGGTRPGDAPRKPTRRAARHNWNVGPALREWRRAPVRWSRSAQVLDYALRLHVAVHRAGVVDLEPCAARTTEHDDVHDGGQLHAVFLSGGDRKSTRLNSSHVDISYAVF